MAASLSFILLCVLLARGLLAQEPGRGISGIVLDRCSGPTDGDVRCYLSTSCRGGLSGDDVSSVAECCGGVGLSYCDRDGCGDCFSDEAYSSSGTEFYLGFFNNLRFESRLSEANFRIQITSDDPLEPADVLVTYDGNEEGTLVDVGPGETQSVEVESLSGEIGIGDRDRAVVVRSLNGARIVVTGLSEEITSADTFCILPTVFLPTLYEYYAVSVPRLRVPSFSDGVQENIVPSEKSAFLIVTTEDSTTITLTLTQSVSTDGAEDLSQFGDTINRGETVSLTLNNEETLYISSVDDLTGSRVVSDKPITFLSGHECGTIPQTMNYCDQLIEQIPPTATWGFQFLTAPILSREAGDAFLVLASEDDTTILGVCASSGQVTREIQFLLDAGESQNFTISSAEFCRFVSDRPILLAQFSFASGTDGNMNADPFMVLLPPLRQYRDSLSFRVFETLASVNESHFINIFLPGGFETDGVRLSGQSIPEDEWEEIPCDAGFDTVCGFAAQLEVGPETQRVEHVDPGARLAVVVYSLAFRTGRGFSAGMMQLPIALDEVSLSAGAYSVLESEERLEVNITRSGRASGSLSLLLRSIASTEIGAQVGEDFEAVQRTVTFAPGQTVATVTVVLAPDDVFPEPDKTFDLFLGPAEDVYISPYAAASVTIINDDPDLPVVEVAFGEGEVVVEEGRGVLGVTLVKTEGAIGPVRVRLFSLSGTASGEGDFQPIDVVVTFETEETEKTQQILIFDDRFLEEPETFFLVLEPINNLDEGAFPVVVIDDTINIIIIDNDVVVIGYNPAPCRTNEEEGELVIQVGILFGVLARNLSVRFETIDGSAIAGQDFTGVSETFTFTPSFSGRPPPFTLVINITDDSLVEETESFSVRLSLVGELDREVGNVVVVNSETDVFIEDNDNAIFTLSATPRVSEGGVATVTLLAPSGQSGGEVEVRVSTVDGNATGGVDFDPLSEVSLTVGDSVDIQIFDNSVFEGDKVFSVVAELVTVGRVGISPSVATITIVDNEDPPRVLCYLSRVDCLEGDNFFALSSMSDCCLLLQAESFSFPDDVTGLCHDCIVIGFNRSEFRLVENNSSHFLTVDVRTGFVPQSITLGLEAVPGSASPEDFSIPPSITLLANQDSRPLDDVRIDLPQEVVNDDEEFESFRINIVDSFGTAPPNMFFRGTVVTIVDFEPVVGFLQTLYMVGEGDDRPVPLVVIVTPPVDLPLQLTLRIVPGTAQIGEDVQFLGDNPLFTIPAGATMATLRGVAIVDDIIFEGDESFIVEIVSLSFGVVGNGATQVEIIDDDVAQIGFLGSARFDGTSYNVVEEEGSVEISVGVIELSLGTEVQIIVTTIDISAQEGEDYLISPEVLTFDPLNLQRNITLTLIDDEIVDNFEGFTIRLSLPPNMDGILLSPDTIFVLIQDSDLPPPVELRFEQSVYTVSEGDTLLLSVFLSSDQGSQLITTEAIQGTATELDYVLRNEVRSEPGSSSVTVQLTIREDQLTEITEVFTLRIVPGEGQVVRQLSEARVIIFDNDEAVVGFRQESYTTFDEGREDPVVVSIGVIAGTLGFDFDFTVESTTGGSATADVDYESFSRDFVLNADVTDMDFTVNVIDDTEFEDLETFFVALFSEEPSDANVTFVPSSALIFIFDNDLPPVGFLNTSLEVSEFSEGGNLVIMASGFSPLGDIQVSLQYINGTARVGEDVVVEVRSVRLDRQTLSAEVPIIPMFDDLYEAEREFFTVRIVDVVGGVIDPETDTATVAIIDETFVQVGGDIQDTSEGAGRAFVVFLIEGTNDVPLTLLFTATTISEGVDFATAGEDFRELVDVPVVVEPGGLFPNVSITIINDLITEFPEQLQYIIRTEMPRVVIFGTQTFSILDDDSVRLAFNQMSATVSERDGEIEFSLAVVEGSLGVDYSLNVSTDSLNRGADAGSDFLPINEMFVLNSETTTVSFAVTIIDDEIPEEDESFTFGVIPPQIEGLRVLLPEQVVVVIEDDDQLRVGFQTTTLTALESRLDMVNVQIVVSGTPPPFLPNEVVVTVSLLNDTFAAFQGFEFGPDVTVIGPTNITLDREISSGSLLFLVNADGLYERSEEVVLFRIVGVSGAQIDPERDLLAVTILDGDQIFVGGSALATRENETAMLEMFIEGFSEIPVTILVSTVNTSTGVPATEGEDYEPLVLFPVTIPATEFFTLVALDIIINDTFTETLRENVGLAFNTDLPRIELDPADILTILDDDPLVVGFSQAQYSVQENQRTISVSVEISTGVLAEGVVLALNLRTRDREVVDTAAAGEDYVSVSTLIQFTQSQTQVVVPITIFFDDLVEPNEQFEVVISIPDNSLIFPTLDPNVAVVTILDFSEPQ